MRKLTTGMCVLGLLLAPGVARAQFSLGFQGSWGEKTDFGVGGRATLDLAPVGMPLAVYATYDYFWPQDVLLLERDYREVNVNAAFVQPLAMPRAQSYIGAGLNIADFTTTDRATREKSSDTKYGVNLIGGSKYKVSRLAPYFEIRYTIEGSEQLSFTFGLDFLLGRGR